MHQSMPSSSIESCAGVSDTLPAYPFTLSLDPANAVRLLLGEVAVLVAIDLAVLKALFQEHGAYATMMMSNGPAIQFCKIRSICTQAFGA